VQGNNACGTVLVKSSHGSEVLLGDGGGVVGGDQGVGVARVADNADIDSLLGDLVQGGSLSFENGTVGLQEVRPLHTGTTRSGTNQDGNIGIFESDLHISGGNDLRNILVGTIVELHDKTFKSLLSVGEFQKLEDDSLVGSEHAALGNEVAEVAADLASGTSDSNSNGFIIIIFFHFERNVSSSTLQDILHVDLNHWLFYAFCY